MTTIRFGRSLAIIYKFNVKRLGGGERRGGGDARGRDRRGQEQEEER